MLVKKFEADNMAAALKQVKDTLGPEALILSTRTLGKKGLGVLGKQLVEVTAAIESPAMRRSSRPQSQAQQAQQNSRQSVKEETKPRRQSLETLEDEQVTLSTRSQQRNTRVEVKENPLEEEVRQLRALLEAQDISKLQAEVAQLKDLMGELSRPRQEEPVSQPEPQPAVERQSPVQPLAAKRIPTAKIQSGVHQDLDELIELLCEQGIEPEAAATIARFAAPQMNDRQRQDGERCRQFLSHTLAGLVQTSGPLWSPGEPQKRIALIGATGVGKTTTIAKLAAEAINNSGARVALVTIDTYRIAAVEQLKVYGEIMGLPVEVVLSPEQLQQAFRHHRDKDLILIDTAGRSPRDQPRLDELQEFLGQDSNVENCLVLAAPTEERLQQQSLQAFSQLPLSRLIFTKLDESDRCGSLVNMATRANLPLAYLTNGQQVPEDLLLAEPQAVADLVMGLNQEGRRIAV